MCAALWAFGLGVCRLHIYIYIHMYRLYMCVCTIPHRRVHGMTLHQLLVWLEMPKAPCSYIVYTQITTVRHKYIAHTYMEPLGISRPEAMQFQNSLGPKNP